MTGRDERKVAVLLGGGVGFVFLGIALISIPWGLMFIGVMLIAYGVGYHLMKRDEDKR